MWQNKKSEALLLIPSTKMLRTMGPITLQSNNMIRVLSSSHHRNDYSYVRDHTAHGIRPPMCSTQLLTKNNSHTNYIMVMNLKLITQWPKL